MDELLVRNRDYDTVMEAIEALGIKTNFYRQISNQLAGSSFGNTSIHNLHIESKSS
jgi:hypothetical protein